ncbi:MAG: extracellular solute-binding protein [Chloroflexota bacterium]|nr:extracellular solute-binding protein [Chloroflexota bacterium]
MRSPRKRLSRRSFLGTTAIAATGVIAAACGGQPAAAPKAAESKPADQKPAAQPKAAESKPGTTTQASAPKSAAATGPVTIRFYTGEDDPPQIKVYEEIIAEYRQTHPNVSFSVTPSPDDVLQKLTTALAARTAPEFSTLVEAEIMELGVRGFLEPVDPIVNDVGREDFKPNSLYVIKGNVFNLPYAGGGLGNIWYRTDLFEQEGLQPPKTWDEWKAAAQKLTKDGTYGFATAGGKGGALAVAISQLFWSSGGTFFDEKLNVAFDGQSKDAMKQALEFYKEMSAFAPPDWQSYNWDGTIDAFLTRKVAMLLYAGRPLGRAAENVPDLVPVMKAFRLPQSRAGYWGHYDHYDSYAVFKKEFGSASPEITMDFLKFLTTGDRAVKFLHTVPGHLTPPLFSIENNPKLWEHPLMQSHKDSIELVFRPGGLYYLNEAGARPGADNVMKTVGIFNLYAGPPTARYTHAEMVQRFILQNEPLDQAIEWGAGEFRRMSDDMKKRIKPEDFGYTG